MENWSENNVEGTGIKLHYHRSGTIGNPCLVLLHGITDGGRVWSRVAHDLSAHYDIVMPDARGHGQSDGISTGFSLTLLAEDVVTIIKALELQKPFLWGHSMGAITAALVAAEYPALIHAVVLEDPPLFAVPPDEPLLPTPLPSPDPDFRAMSVAERLATAKAMNPTWHPDELPPWAESKAQVDPTVIHHRSEIRQYPWREALQRIECPTLLLTGTPQAGAIVTPEVGAEALALLKAGQGVEIEGAGHNIRRDRYEQTMDTVRTFLRMHEL